jgi:hypothetical protein
MGVRMKGIQNKKKKKNIISETNCHTHIRFMSSERKTLEVLFRAWLNVHAPPGQTDWLGDGSAEVDQLLDLLGRDI